MCYERLCMPERQRIKVNNAMWIRGPIHLIITKYRYLAAMANVITEVGSGVIWDYTKFYTKKTAEPTNHNVK